MVQRGSKNKVVEKKRILFYILISYVFGLIFLYYQFSATFVAVIAR